MILGVGLSRTGTKSLNKALQILGYNTIHLPSKQQLFNNSNYDGFTDIPCYAYLDQLLTIYPDSQIIYTTRNFDSWIKSCQSFFKNTNNPYLIELRNIVYGQITYNEEAWKIAYEIHALKMKMISHYVKTLYLPLESTDKWQLLTNFLNKPIPNVNYPHYDR